MDGPTRQQLLDSFDRIFEVALRERREIEVDSRFDRRLLSPLTQVSSFEDMNPEWSRCMTYGAMKRQATRFLTENPGASQEEVRRAALGNAHDDVATAVLDELEEMKRGIFVNNPNTIRFCPLIPVEEKRPGGMIPG